MTEGASPVELPNAGPNPGVLPEEFYAAIGVIVVRWSLFEEAANIAIAGLLKTSPGRFLPIGANLQGQTRFNALIALAEQQLPRGKLSELRDLLKPLGVLIADRNKVVHGTWRSTTDPDICVLLTARARGKLNLRGDRIAIGALITLGNSIGMVKDDLVRFLDQEGLFPNHITHEPK